MSVRTTRLLFVAVVGACLATSALAAAHSHSKSHGKSTPSTSHSSLIWRGDDATASGVVNEVARVWEKDGHGHIELQPFNTASGIDAVSMGTADLAGSARPSDGSAQNDRLTFTPVAWDGVVIIAQASNPVSSLTLKQVHDIYFGKIHNWSEVGGRNAPIDVYAVASPGDGVEYSLRSLLFGRGNQPVAAPRLYVNMRKLEEGVALNPNGMGAATLTGISGNSQLKAIPINGKPATVANIADGSYPLFIPLYLVTNPSSPKATQAQAFVDFLQSQTGKAALRNHAVLPYADGAALIALNDSRRPDILAEVGARPRQGGTPISAPGATYAARVAMAPTSANTMAAKMALERRQAATPDQSQINQASSLAKSAATTYTVSKGDTLSSIARAHRVDVAQLRAWNHLKSNQLQLGQVLRLSEN